MVSINIFMCIHYLCVLILIIGSDFTLNATVPRLTYRANNTLNDIPFQPITSFVDNFIEGNETIRVIILPGGDNVVQVQRDRQTATITIIDDDCKL